MIQDGTSGRLPANIGRFARLLRRAGIAIGPGDVLVAAAAVAAVDMASRTQVHAALKATLVKRREHLPLFEQAFDVFWRDPQLRERLLSLLLPQVESERTPDGRKLARRLADAFAGDAPPPPPPPEEKLREETRIDASLTWDATERLKTRDFEQMSADEAAEARRAIRLLRTRLPERPVRRLKAAPRGPRIDLRRSLRGQIRTGGEAVTLARRRHRRARPPLVAIVDVSGSMDAYARMMLHLLHAMMQDAGQRVSVFLFGTRLSEVTRELARRDPDEALEAIGRKVKDWSGGTRIGPALAAFNRRYARRVLTRNAVVLLVTDGLDRAEDDSLSRAVERLAHLTPRLIWLNPLLRFDGFQPAARGVRAILPHVHEFRAVHNLTGLKALATALTRTKAEADPRLEAWRRGLRADDAAVPIRR
ncbi:vWA domain-containing protein [Tistrella mobilis]|uniref:VWA containing CoxE family protein n=1 Tax=Tistrella mobilis (strain KA081020-065) TaxID=1110502 RepID=I3TJS3_TISMK|nr:VWA domain-containing protein [Tistrella mobilis]AFK53011.1 VWA containing CoxE family protein [Tistrella mobilis KA081020-065]